jgi:single-stranded-DNA-specific exonuclease
VPARWVAAPVPPAAEALVAAGYPRRLATLLALRDVRDVEEARRFLAPAHDDLHDPAALPGFAAAVARLARAAAGGEVALVVGDYDVDGVSATALLTAALAALGARPTALLPRRDAEGYGLQPLHARRAAEAGATLLVAVDSGTNAVDAADEARRLGIDLVVVDHHLPEGAELRGAIVVNPRLDDRYPCPDLTAAGLALKLAAALFDRSGRPVPWEALLRVAALGTVADVAPLVGENRVVVALGLRALAEPRSPGLRALMAVAGVRAPVAAADVAFRLAPRLNAAGRLGSADAALELLMTRDAGRAERLARELHELNAQRQRVEERLLEEARAELARRGGSPPPIVVAWGPGWHRGVVGIAAARLAREVNRPTLLLAVDGELAVGSGRSAEGIALHDFLRPWAARLERFGGHAQAVGLTARAERLEALREEWETAAGAWAPRFADPVRRYDLALEPAELDEELMRELERLEPFGAGNLEPLFRFGPCRLAGAARDFGRGHLSFAISRLDGGATVPVVAWRGAERKAELEAPFELLAAVERDRPRGLRLRLVELRPAGSAAEARTLE